MIMKRVIRITIALKGCNTVLVPRGSPFPIHRKHEYPRETSLNDNVVCGDVKGVEGKQVCNNKTAIKTQDKRHNKNGCILRHPAPIRDDGPCSH